MSNDEAVTSPSMPCWATERRWLVVLLAMAFALRVTSIIAMSGLSTPPKAGTDDQEYDRYAWNLVSGKGYSGPSIDVPEDHLTAYRPPVVSLFFASVYLLFGHSFAAAKIANALVGALTVLPVDAIGRRAFDARVGRLAAAAVAVSPAAMFFGVGLLSEPIAGLLTALVVWFSLGVRDANGMAMAIGMGISYGLLLLTKPGFLFVLPFLPFWALLICGRDRRLWSRVLVVPVLIGLVMAPWIIRNFVVMHALIPFGTGGGQLILATSNRVVVDDPELYGYSVSDHYLPEYRPALVAAGDELKRDAIAKKFGMDWLKANSDKWFYLARNRFLRFWEPWLHRDQTTLLIRFVELLNSLMLVLMIGPLVTSTISFIKTRDPAIIIQAMLLGNTIMAMIFHGQPRYRFPIEPLCYILAAAGAYSYAGFFHRCGSVSAVVGEILNALRRHYLVAGSAILAVLGLAYAVRLDNRHMEAYRGGACDAQLARIASAVEQYRAGEGKPPEKLEDLVPKYLPNFGALHCPKHSVKWHEYSSLYATETGKGRVVVSYTLVDDKGSLRIEEIVARHGPVKKSRAVNMDKAPSSP